MSRGALGLGRVYRGELAVPIDVEVATQSHVKAEFSRKLDILFVEYGIAPGDWEALAFTMALHHVPGFQVVYVEEPGKVGRPGRWTDDETSALAVVVDRIMTEAKSNPAQVSRRTISGACEHIARSGFEPRFATPSTSDAKTWAKTLAKQVSAARRQPSNGSDETSTTGRASIEKHFAKPPV